MKLGSKYLAKAQVLPALKAKDARVVVVTAAAGQVVVAVTTAIAAAAAVVKDAKADLTVNVAVPVAKDVKAAAVVSVISQANAVKIARNVAKDFSFF